MGVRLEVHVYEVEPNTGSQQIFCAETAFDHIPENNVKAYGDNPYEALKYWADEIQENEVFRPD